jgi:predicted permease
MNITYAALLASVAPTFVVLACGFALRRFRGLHPEADASMLTVAVNFLYPCLIADTVLRSTALRDVRTVAVAPVVGFSLLLLCFGIAALSARLLRLKWPQPARTFAFTAAIPNWGYLPIPLVQQLFGTDTTGILFVHNIGLELALWSIGIWLLSGSSSWRRMLTIPFFAILGALALNFAHAADWLPHIVLDSLHMLGQAAIPLSLLLTGAMLADSVISLRNDRRPLITITGCIVRAALLPPLFLAAARWLPVSLDLKRVLAVQAAMPCAMVPVLLSRHFRGDTGTAVQIVLASTALGLLTIPLWLHIGFAWLGLQ